MKKSVGLEEKAEAYEPMGIVAADIRPSGVGVKHLQVHSGAEATCLRFNGLGTYLATGGGDSVVKIWDANNGECVDTLRIHSKPVSALALSYSGELLLTCSVDRQMKFYNMKFKRVTNQMSGGHTDSINACCFCQSQAVALTGSSDRTIKIWDANVTTQRGKMACASGIMSLDIAMSDSVVASGHRDGSLKFWSIKDNSLVFEVKKVHDDLVSSVRYNPSDGNQIFTSGNDHTVKVVDIRMHKVLHSYENEFFYNTRDTASIGVSPGGRYVALGSKNGNLIILDAFNDGDLQENFKKDHQGGVVAVEWAARTGKLASVDQKGTLIMWT